MSRLRAFFIGLLASLAAAQTCGADEEAWRQFEARGSAALREGRYDDAIAALRQSLLDDRQSVTAALDAARAFLLKGDSGRALDWLVLAVSWGYDDPQALERDPLLRRFRHDAYYAYSMARARARAGDAASAVAWMTRAVDWGFIDVDKLNRDEIMQPLESRADYLALLLRLLNRNRASVSPIKFTSPAMSSELVVMIDARLNGTATFGAGILMGHSNDDAFIATADHVVRSGSREAEQIKVRIKAFEHIALPGQLLRQHDPALDLAVLRVSGLRQLGLRFCALPLDRFGDADGLKRRDEVFPVGYPAGVAWGMPIEADHISRIEESKIVFQSLFIGQGHSGGALMTPDGRLVGMIRADAPPFGIAIDMGRVGAQMQRWGYPVQLRRPAAGSIARWRQAVQDRDRDELQQQLTNCAAIRQRDENGWRAIHHAAGSGWTEGVRRLLEAGTDPNVLTEESGDSLIRQRTPLHLAAGRGAVEVVALLLRQGARINVKAVDHWGRPWAGTALHAAVAGGHAEVIRLLLDHGALVDWRSNEGSPLAVAARYDRAEAARLLLDAGAKPDYDRTDRPLWVAAEQGSLATAKVLVEGGADVNLTGTYADTSLHRAAKGGYTEVARLLIAAGAQVDVAREGSGRTPLHVAVVAAHPDMVKLLLEAGADPLVRTRRGATAADLTDSADLKQLIRTVRAKEHGWLGVEISDLTEEMATEMDLDDARGIRVVAVSAEGPAERGGLEVGDVVRSVDDHPIRKTSDLLARLRVTPPGEQVRLGVWRRGETLSLIVKLGSAPE